MKMTWLLLRNLKSVIMILLICYCAGIVDADLLIILSDIEGLYTANPATNSDATLIETVSEITDETYAIAGGAGSNMGTGGMYTKIKAAHMATNSGVPMVITSGEVEDSVRRM